MTESDKILTAEYLDWHAKLSRLPSILTDKICSKLYKRNWMRSMAANRST